MKRSLRDRPRGFSLLEVTIAGIILVTVIFMVFSVLHQSQTAAAIGTATGEAEERGQRVLDVCKSELMFAKLVMSDFPSAKTRIRYQIPNKSGALAYGATDGSGTFQTGWSFVIRFVQEKTYLEPQAADVSGAERHRLDLNRNSSPSDAFSIGKLVRETYDGTLLGSNLVTTVVLSDDVVLRYPTMTDDVNGDGAGDPVFELLDANGAITIASPGTVRQVRVTVWHGLFGPNHDTYHLRNNRQVVQLRNIQ